MKKSKKVLLIFSILIIILIVSFFIDKQATFLIQKLRTPLLDTFFSYFLFFEKAYIFYPVLIALPIILLIWKRRKNLVKPFSLSIIISFIIVFIIKLLTSRQRPIPEASDFNFGIFNHSIFSAFPSGHTTMAFAALPYIEYKIFKWISILWFIFACLFGLTRFWFGLHYLSDIISGAILGYVISFIIKKSWKKLKTSKTKQTKKKSKRKKAKKIKKR